VQPYDWAVRFNGLVRQAIANGRWEPLIDYLALGEDAARGPDA
jgi:hypothetical protein